MIDLDFDSVLYIFSGLFITLKYTFSGVFIGIIFGTIFAILQYNKKLNWIIKPYITVIRGTPLLLQLSFAYFVLPRIFGTQFSIYQAGFLAFGINSTAYVAEIMRSGIQSVDKGQFLAAKALHIPSYLIWKDIILPQALRKIFPALINEFITIMKDTSIISILGEADIMRRFQTVSAEEFTYFEPLMIAGLCYLIPIFILEKCANFYEKRISYD